MKKKIRILEAIRQGQVGGGETHVYDLATHLDIERFEPIVLSFTDGEMVDKLRKKGIETHVIHTTKPFDRSVKRRVKALMIERDIDIVHAHGTRAASNTIHISKQLKLPIIYTIHGWSFNENQSKITSFLRRKVERYITKRTTVNICVSKSNKQTGINYFGDFKAEVIQNGISLEKFDYRIDHQYVLEELEKKEGEVWVGFMARMTFQKNPIGLINAFSIAKKKNDKLKLLMVGNGELEADTRQHILAKGLTHDVKILPFRSDIPQLLAAIDIYCLPSFWEGLPIGVLEAMAMRKPIIASNVDGTKEILDYSNGRLVSPSDRLTLSDEILALASDRALRDQMGLKGYKKIVEKFELRTMVNKTENVYAQIIH